MIRALRDALLMAGGSLLVVLWLGLFWFLWVMTP